VPPPGSLLKLLDSEDEGPTPGLANFLEGACLCMSVIVEEILSHTNGNFGEQHKVLGVFHKFLSVTAIVIINAYYSQSMQSIIIVLPIKDSSRNAISNKMWQ
jgi:hypothetical protein